MDVPGRLPATRDLEIAPARRSCADEDRIEVLVEERPQALHPLAVAGLDVADPDDVADSLVDHLLGQTKTGDLAANHAAAPALGVEQDELVAQRREVARDRQRGRPGADQGDPLAVP